MEKWANIQGYEGLYRVSDSGEVLSVKKNIILKPFYSDSGYRRVTLRKLGRQKKHPVHRLVATEFALNLLNKPFVNHINGIKDDNRAENLEWCTASENARHNYEVLGYRQSKEAREKKRQKMLGFKNGESMKAKLRAIARGEGNNGAKLSELAAIEIFASKDNANELASKHGVSRATITGIRSRRTWKHIHRQLGWR